MAQPSILSDVECATLLAELQSRDLSDARPIREILGLAVALGTPWKQLRVGELKTLLALVIGGEAAVREGCDGLQHFKDMDARVTSSGAALH